MASSYVQLCLCAFLLCGGLSYASEDCAQPIAGNADDLGDNEIPFSTVELLQTSHKIGATAKTVAVKAHKNTKLKSRSPNGLLYICDPDILASSANMCKFISSDDTTFTCGPHDVNTDVAEDGHRAVADADGNKLAVTPQPWTEGDQLVESTTELTGSLLNYAKAFEMMAPLRDAMMFAPESIITSTDRWNLLTKAFVDCHVKEVDESPALGRDSVYAKVTNPNGADIHHFVLQFLEEGSIDLVCLMTDLSMDERCPAIREANGVTTTSNCWEDAYAEVSAADLTVTGAPTTETTSAPTPATTPAPTPAQGGSGGPPSKPR